MFAAASNRAAVIALLAASGADLKATSKVTDLAALSKDPAACATSRSATRHLRASRRRRPQRSGAQAQAARGGRGGGTAGVDRNYQLNELVAAQGGLTPLLLAAREGHIDSVRALLDAGADVNQVSAGDKTSPLLIATINGHFDLAKLLLDKGADVKARGREQRDAAVRGAERRVGAQGALSAAARADEPEDDLSRADEGLARQGRRSRTFA
jgi:ankyrin repeat protein